MAFEGFFPHPPAIFFLVLRGAGAAGTDADVVGAALFEPAALTFSAGFSPFCFNGAAPDVVDAVLGRGEDRPTDERARV
jgi:hypothetical protein